MPVTAHTEENIGVGEQVCIAVRPEKISISLEQPADKDAIAMRGVVHDLGYFGLRSLYRIELQNGHIIQVSRQNQRRSARRFVEWEDEVWISWQPASTIVMAGED